MKTVLLTLTLLFTMSFVAQDKYDVLIEKTGMIKEVKTFVNKYIDKLATQSNGVTQSQWETIKTKIDYSAYFIGIKAILQNNYTIAELNQIFLSNDMLDSVNDTGVFIYKPKPEVKEQMYKTSRAFGKLLNVQIKKLIKDL